HETDGVRVVLHALDDFLVAGLAMGLEPDVRARPLDQRRIPFLAAMAGLALDQVCPVAQGHVGTVRVNGLVGPFTRESELTPGTDVLLGTTRSGRRPLRAVPCAAALRAEDAVD